MVAINLNIQDEVYEKVMYFLKSLPKSDVQITEKRVIEGISPTTLDEEDFDYMDSDYLKEIDKVIAEAKEQGLDNLQSYEEFKDEL